MKQEMYVLPVKCAGCYRVFDLWRVLQDQEGRKGVNDYGAMLQQSLCPQCQELVSQETAEFDSAEDATQEVEYQMTLEFE